MKRLVAATLAASLSGLTGQPPKAIPVHLGPIPSPEGFVVASGRLDDSYRDLRSEFKKNREFGEIIALVDDPEEAVILLEVVDRGIVDTGVRTGNTVATGPTTAVTTSQPVRTKQLNARFVVRGSEFQQFVDGAQGLRIRTYRNQAENVLKQLVEWVKVNRAKLDQQIAE